MKGYVIKSISCDGIYYLCNGWNKHKTYWVEYKKIDKAIFKTIGQAKASLTKLLKIMEDYKEDNLSVCKIYDNYDIIEIGELK